MKRSTEVLVAIAAGVAIIVGSVYVANHTNIHCFDWFGLAKGCVATTH